MSADNWRICPKCNTKAVAAIRSFETKVNGSYGKVSVDEYERLKSQLASRQSLRAEESLRENYQICTDVDGTFYISYRASCDKCDYQFSFKHEQKTL